MEQVPTLPPVPLELRQAASRFRQLQLQNYRFKFKIKYEELLALFQNLNLSFTDIGKRLGVSRERIRQLHEEFFWTVRSPDVRKKFKGLGARGREDVQEKEASIFTQEPHQTLAACAESMGFEVKLVYKDYYVSRRKLQVNGKKCLVSHTTGYSVIKGNPYVSVRLSKRRAALQNEFLLVYANLGYKEERFRHVFCIPLNKFVSRYAIYIPLKGSLKNSEWGKYSDEEGLSLLK